jgi:hypothetical protein
MATTNIQLAKAFKAGLSRRQVTRKYKVTMRRVDKALRQYLNKGVWANKYT